MDYVGRKAKDLAESDKARDKALSEWYEACGQKTADPTAAADRYVWPASSH